MELSPIILFVYNRPAHTRKVLQALQSNNYAADSRLYIFSDGPKDSATEIERQKIKEVRSILIEKNWCQEVHITEYQRNKGLANSIIEGVSEIFREHKTAIVLEDDLVTSPYFLKYMNEALNFYDSYKSVFSICADRPPYSHLSIPRDYTFDVFVSLRSFSTGWATWRDRWDKVNWDLRNIDDFLSNPLQIKAFNRGGEDLTTLLKLQLQGRIDSWAIRFTFTHFVQHAVAILPCKSYVDNVGFDGTGVHSGSVEEGYRKDINLAVESPKFTSIIYEDERIINSFYNGYNPSTRPIWQKAINRLCRLFGGSSLFVIKRKVYLQ